MLYLITLSVLVATNSIFGASLNAQGVSIPLYERQAYWDAGKHSAKVKKLRSSSSSVDMFKRHIAHLDGKLDGMVWVGQIEIGTSPQKFEVAFNTGSADTWVYSSTCKGQACSSRKKYDALNWKTTKPQPGELTTHYLNGGAISGLAYADTITVAGLKAESQVFFLVDAVIMKDFGIDGLLGLGLGSRSQLNAPNIINTLFSQQKITKHIFSMQLSSTLGSELFIGGANPLKYTGIITYVPILSQAEWIVKGTASVNSEKVFTGGMVIDSGTMLIHGPEDSVKKWWSEVSGSAPCPEADCKGTGFYMFSCLVPLTVSFWFNGREFVVSAGNFIIRKLYGNQMCVGAIRINESLKKEWILGSQFMKNVYTIFDASEARLRVGFATLT
ncbi:aspartic protease [Rhizoctonia solani AG-3 Rhs1AP]|uniref:Aspartic protease n=1 Tax=Rhizoctonia solani AG-3 Rhs1AP TaxID=1086054 RepID=X8J188_9AGAM|nr:aspartic protease [Rhizoctonia solani AG-3 Rhs1AP]